MHEMDVDEQEDKYFSATSPKIEEEGREIFVATNLYPDIPEKSRELYENAYKKLMDWCKTKNSTEITENVMVMYFSELSEKFKSSTLWSQYSMLKTMILVKNSINISNYRRLLTLLKKKSVNYEPKRSLTLTREQVIKFFKEADDERYLMIKVALIFGIHGGCRRKELYSLKEEDIKELVENVLSVTVRGARSSTPRTFTVINDSEVDYVALYKKYADLRKGKSIGRQRFFLKYCNNRCRNQVVGINTLGRLPSIIAEFLNLDNPNMYTGHCFRRSSQTLLAGANVDTPSKKRHTSWQNINEAEACREYAMRNREFNVDDPLAGTVVKESSSQKDPLANTMEHPSTSIPAPASPTPSISNISLNTMEECAMENRIIHLHNCSNITININRQ